MMRFHPKPLALAGLLALCSFAHAGDKVWISLGDAALAQLQQHTAVKLNASVAPAAQLAGAASASRSAESIHLVQVDEDDLLHLSAAVHRELRRCGGFMFHPSQAEGLATLQR
ncbi:MAG TPA: leucyl aminopeptidase, partial [Roseateles sp.]